jgi:hypothetical protein
MSMNVVRVSQRPLDLTVDERHRLLSFLCTLLIDAHTSAHIVRLYRPVAPILLSVLTRHATAAPLSVDAFENISAALAHLLPVLPHVAPQVRESAPVFASVV